MRIIEYIVYVGGREVRRSFPPPGIPWYIHRRFRVYAAIKFGGNCGPMGQRASPLEDETQGGTCH